LTKFDTIEITKNKNKISSLEIWLGKKKEVDVYIKEDIFITVSKGKKRLLSANIEYQGPIHAPINKDQKVAVLNIFENKELISTHDVLAMHEVKRVNIISRIVRSFNFLIWGDV
jgi:D-alanyl-D-alanine carboxypeptidase (penicillin-binding protein 5/6)